MLATFDVRAEFPALGFDPAPGDPAALTDAAEALEGVRAVAADSGAAVARLDTDGWVGEAGDGFRARIAPLPADLDRVARAHRRAAAALAGYGAELRGRQRRAVDLEARAAELRRLLAAVGPATAGPAVAGSAAAGKAAAVAQELAGVLADARRLQAEHVAAAEAAARALREATDPPYQRPGRLARAVGTVRSWVRDHAEDLAHVSTVLRGVSAVLGTVSLVPGMQFLTPFAILAGGAAVAIDLAIRVASGRGSWTGLALDAALTVVPAGPVARVVKRLPGAAPVLRAANRAVPAGVKGRVFRAAGNRPDGIGRAAVETAAALIRRQAPHYGDDVIVQGSRAGYSTRPGSDIDIGLRVTPDRFEQILRDRFGDPVSDEFAGIMAGCREKGIVHVRRAGMLPLARELERVLGCKVDISVIRRDGSFDREPWLPI